MDLLARKLGKRNGQVFAAFIKEVIKMAHSAKRIDSLADLGDRLETAANRLAETAAFMGFTEVQGGICPLPALFACHGRHNHGLDAFVAGDRSQRKTCG